VGYIQVSDFRAIMALLYILNVPLLSPLLCPLQVLVPNFGVSGAASCERCLCLVDLYSCFLAIKKNEIFFRCIILGYLSQKSIKVARDVEEYRTENSVGQLEQIVQILLELEQIDGSYQYEEVKTLIMTAVKIYIHPQI
jgi:hypothetical protein